MEISGVDTLKVMFFTRLCCAQQGAEKRNCIWHQLHPFGQPQYKSATGLLIVHWRMAFTMGILNICYVLTGFTVTQVQDCQASVRNCLFRAKVLRRKQEVMPYMCLSEFGLHSVTIGPGLNVFIRIWSSFSYNWSWSKLVQKQALLKSSNG